MSNPGREYCEERFRELARELTLSGYGHVDITSGCLNAGYHHANEDGSWPYYQFLEHLGEVSEHWKARLRLMEEDLKAETQPDSL